MTVCIPPTFLQTSQLTSNIKGFIDMDKLGPSVNVNDEEASVSKSNISAMVGERRRNTTLKGVLAPVAVAPFRLIPPLKV